MQKKNARARLGFPQSRSKGKRKVQELEETRENKRGIPNEKKTREMTLQVLVAKRCLIEVQNDKL